MLNGYTIKMKAIKVITTILVLGFFSAAGAKAQQKMQVVEDNAIKVNLRKPPQPTNHYLDNNKPKRKLKVKIRMVKGPDCPRYLHYTSRPQKHRDKILEKRRRKIGS